MKTIPLKQKTLLIIFGIFLSFILIESGLRIAGFVYLSVQEYHNKNSLKNGECRVLCLGESTTAFGYPRRLEEILNDKRMGVQFSVINKGVSGTNTGIILTRLNSYLEHYRPDIVVTMMGINDDLFSDSVENIFGKGSLKYAIATSRLYKFFKLLKLNIKEKLNTTEGFNRDSDNYHEVEKALKKNIELNTEDVEGHIELGWHYCHLSEYDKAEIMLKKAISLDPKSSNAYLKLGWCYQHQGRFDKSEESLKMALEFFPDNVSAYRALGSSYMSQKRYQEAEKMLKKAISLKPNDIGILIQIGKCYSLQKRYKEAEDIFKKAETTLMNNPADRDGYISLGRYYTSKKKYQEAEKMLKRAIEIKDEDLDIYIEDAFLALGQCYERQGMHEKAANMYRKAKEFDLESESMKHFFIKCSQKNKKKLHNKEDDRYKYYLSSTSRNYQKLREILIKNKIILICAEYPMRDNEELKNIVGEHRGVYFVDNQKSFMEAVEESGYWDYFVDNFGKEFGHMTDKGMRLLSENIAKVICEKCFN